MHERLLPASPNWYFSRCSDVSSGGLLGVGAKNLIYLIDVSASACRVSGKLVGHQDLVSGFSFCQQPGQAHLCVSAAVDGALRFWDSDSAQLIREHAAHQNPISAVHWSPADKNLVVSGDEKGVVACHWYHTGDAASFVPEPRPVSCLSCSPHAWSLVAVGYKDGVIALIDVSRKGQVVHRLRGHDDEVHSLAWAPRAHEDALGPRPEDGGAANGVASAAEEQGCFLASGSRDQTVRVWSSARGRGVMTLKLPYLKRRGSAVDPGVKERLWLHVHWPKGRATQLVSSCFSGELLLWDLTRTGKQRWTLLGGAAEGQNHSRIVFNMSSVQLQGRELLLSTSMDREIRCWDLASLDCCWTLPTMGGTVYALAFSPVGLGCLAAGVGDNMIRVWNTLATQNHYDIRTLWQGIRCKVSALAWHPSREGSLAFGTDDGKVGVYDVFSNKPPQISSSYHRKTVYTLAWGPPVPPLSSGRPAALSLYSCAGEGVILQHDPSHLSGEASDIDKLIRDTNNITHKLSPHTDLNWKPDGSVVAVGNEDGCIEVFQAPDLRLLCSIQQHHKTINALRWHPGHAPGHAPGPTAAAAGLHGLLASGSSNAIVYVHDLSSVIEDPPESPAVLTEPYRRLAGQTAKITGLSWSPHHSARLATASYDGTAQVWDVLEEAAVANYRGHEGFLLSVDWSPVDPDVVWTGGRDFTVQEWRVSRQEFTKPPIGRKLAGLKEKMKANPQLKKKKSKKKQDEPGDAAAAATASPEPSGDAVWRRRDPSEDEDKDEASSSSSSVPAAPETPRHSAAATAKPRDKPDAALLKRKKPRSLLPLSAAMDHLPKETQLQDCVALAALHSRRAPPAGCVPGRGEHVHLGLFTDRQALHRLLDTEEQGHVEAGHYDSVVYLRLWSGDLQGALQLATERGELNDHLLSVAPMAGFEAWRRAVEAFVQQLCLQEQYLKAASHLLSLSRVYEAVELLRSHRLYREAVALARARLPPEDPVLKELFSSWAAALEKDGHLSSAAKCHLAVGAGFDAAKVISRKSDAASMRAAAAVARLSGEDALARSLTLRCAKTLAAGQDWTAAQEALSAQDGLLVHQLHLSVAELLTAALQGSGVIPPTPCPSGHTWASPGRCGGGFLDRVRAVWEEQWGVSGGQAAVLLQELGSSDCPPPSSSVPLPQVLLYSSLHVALGVLVWLQGGGARLLRELWAALSWTREAGLFSVSAELCRMLFPHGDVRACSSQDPEEEEEEEEAEAAAASLQAFVLYHRLYEGWWAGSAGPGGPGEGPGSDGALDASLLLSEPHAALQSSQRAVRQIRERLSSMVTQHSRGRGLDPERRPGGEPGSTPDSVDAGERPADQDQDQDSLLSLSSSMAQHQQRLADLPDSVKAFARPDVLECCLLLLHRGQAAPPLPDRLQRRATDLLLRYGNTPSVQKASRRFLT